MYVVTVDDRRRIKLPKDFVKPKDKILILNAETRLVLIKIPPKPFPESSSWLRTSLSKAELRRLGLEKALEEVSKKLERKDADRN